MAIQLRRGKLSELDESKLLPGELAVCTDGTIAVCVKAGKVVYFLTNKNSDYMLEITDAMENLKSGIEDLLVDKVSINDSEASAAQAWSGYKTQATIDSEADQLNNDLLVLTSRVNGFTKLPSGSSASDAEIIDGRTDNSGYAHTNIGENIRAVEASVTIETKKESDRAKSAENDLMELIDTLNDGGLQLKESVIAEKVLEWLGNHPEATTTVQSHSLDLSKLIIGTLGYVTPEMFGAKGDGTTDDTNAVKSAIDFACTANIPVLFNGKQFVISSKITINNKIQMIGHNFHDKQVNEQEPNNADIKFIGIDTTMIELLASGSVFSGIVFYSTNKNTNGIDCKYIRNKFENNTFFGFNKGINLEKTGTTWVGENKIYNNLFSYCNYGVYNKNTNDSEICDNVFARCLYSVYSEALYGFTFSRNHDYSINGFMSLDMSGSSIIDNYFDNRTHESITAVISSSGNIISLNRFFISGAVSTTDEILQEDFSSVKLTASNTARIIFIGNTAYNYYSLTYPNGRLISISGDHDIYASVYGNIYRETFNELLSTTQDLRNLTGYIEKQTATFESIITSESNNMIYTSNGVINVSIDIASSGGVSSGQKIGNIPYHFSKARYINAFGMIYSESNQKNILTPIALYLNSNGDLQYGSINIGKAYRIIINSILVLSY